MLKRKMKNDIFYKDGSKDAVNEVDLPFYSLEIIFSNKNIFINK